MGQHGGVVVSVVISQQEGSEPASSLRPFCVEFPCCVEPSTMWSTGYSKLSKGGDVSVNGCSYLFISLAVDW